ncbi:PAS domain-containing protein [Neorhizobium sp. P12A]|uniref:PAS domain-containing sensor histidine kinase n=1 Tax=Neorhizobium sp. P12A TaxID=2268027 RepID=UPI0011EECAA0|nr:PAS domain-containing sensor histidine kinase [Neorhizobium sp. P12A]KAA0687344.1 PAS domain-containing protein [Neorhizobium sp. P12A]
MTEKKADLDYKQLFDDAPCGYLLVDTGGVIVGANAWMSTVLGYPAGGLDGKRLRDIFSIAARILYETNLAPLLKLQQAVSEVTLDLKRVDGTAVPVIMAASSAPNSSGLEDMTRIAFVHAGERRLYERQLVSARDSAEKDLAQQQSDGVLREQFIAILGHDLRNPLASISAAARILGKETLSDRSRQVIALMQGSALRMSGLIDNVLDFTRARLGGGIGVELHPEQALEPLLDQVVQELRASNPAHEIVATYDVTQPVKCDASKIGQLVSNLLGNALTHGDRATPIHFHAETTDSGLFRVWIANGGPSIPEEVIPKLFDPFARGESHGYKEGLGLGLFIASEIAKAHGGTLVVRSSEGETRFTFEMTI